MQIILGHTTSFFRDIEGTIDHARSLCLVNSLHSRGQSYSRKCLDDTREPIAFTVAGQTVYVLISVNDIYAAQRADDDLNHDVSRISFMSSFGVAESGLQILFEDPPPSLLASKTIEPNAGRKNMTHVGAALFVTQLAPGKNLNIVQETCTDLMNRKLAPDSVSSSSLSSFSRSRITLLVWTSRILIESTISAFFGPTLLEIELQLASIFLDFDDTMWKLLYHVPPPWANDMMTGKTRLRNALVTYLESSSGQKASASWFVIGIEVSWDWHR